MLRKERSMIVAWGLTAAVMLGLVWAGPAFAQVADGDGFDGDEVILPVLFFVIAAVLVGVALLAAWRGRRSQPPSQS